MDDLLNACRRASEILEGIDSSFPLKRIIQAHPQLRDHSREIADRLGTAVEIHCPPTAPDSAPPSQTLKAVAWNIERGKRWEAVAHVMLHHPEIREADLFFVTEVDWGMARSGNQNIAAELAKAIDYCGYFAPSYFNFTKGHGSERDLPGQNALGLHGKAILSRYRLKELRAVPLSNATDKLFSKEARLGEKRALMGELHWGERNLTLACAHLDAFSSPRARARQLSRALAACAEEDHVLLAGDWNTNTLDSTSASRILFSIARQLVSPGPRQMIRRHFSSPQDRFDRPLFAALRRFGFDTEGCNEPACGTYDLLSNDPELGKMASDQYPGWILRWINRQLEKSGGRISLKLDWFAAKNLFSLRRKVIPLKPEDTRGLGIPSDHHPILLEFSLTA